MLETLLFYICPTQRFFDIQTNFIDGREMPCQKYMGRLKMQDMKMTDQVAGHENDGPSK